MYSMGTVEQNSFASSFLMCYRFFMTNDQLLSCLLCKFIATPDVIGESVDVAGRMILRLRYIPSSLSLLVLPDAIFISLTRLPE